MLAPSEKSSVPTTLTKMKYVMNAKYERHTKPIPPAPVAPAMLDLLAYKASIIDPTNPPAEIEKLIFNKYDTRPPSVKVDKPQYQGHFAGRKPEHHQYNPKTIPQANQTVIPNPARPQKFQHLAGTTHAQEKWWYNEAVPKSQQGAKADTKVAPKVNEQDRQKFQYRNEANKWGKITGKI